jgi:excisionase family DNA binding protein
MGATPRVCKVRPDAEPTEPLMTVDEVAALLRTTRRTVYRYKREGSIPFLRIGRRLLFSRQAVLAWAERESRTQAMPVGTPVRASLLSGVPSHHLTAPRGTALNALDIRTAAGLPPKRGGTRG